MADPVAQAALDRAFDEREQLLLLYQPIHSVATGALYGAEALLRQRRRSGEIREASIISDTAEENGGPELYMLDNLVVRKAYREAAQWPDELRLHVNLSPRELEAPNLRERVSGLEIDPHRVCLEITETSHIEHPEETVHVLRDLREFGFALWLDDFGTGHSSLEHLQLFPLDGLKVPKNFMSEAGRPIARAIISLACELGLKSIAEGVETREQLEFLRELHCDYVQGFLFSRPLTPEQFRSGLPEHTRRGGDPDRA